MNKNKLLTLISLASVFAIASTVIAVNSGTNNYRANALTRNGGSEVWHHYAAISPTSTRHGSRQFWAKGSEDCQTPYYENPGVTCVEHDFSTYEAFYNMSPTDPRYIAPTTSSPVENGDDTVTYGIYPQTYLKDTDDNNILYDDYGTLNAIHYN